MAKRIEFTCDGCDKVQLVKTGSGHPLGWGEVKVSVTGLANPYIAMNDAQGERTYDLCASCQQTIYFNHNPRQWPRALETTNG